jgi:transposase
LTGSLIGQIFASIWLLFYSSTGRPSMEPERMIRMLLVGYTMGDPLRASAL